MYPTVFTPYQIVTAMTIYLTNFVKPDRNSR